MTTHEAFYSSSSSSSKLLKYDVFLSFRGEDTRYGFSGHLHAALKDGGEEIKEELFQTIEESRISIIVFSKRYADSSWCLDELVKIMECRDERGREILPVFYDGNPSDVRKQGGCLVQAFQNHEDGILEEKDDKEERVKQWREALTRAAKLSGHHLQNGGGSNDVKMVGILGMGGLGKTTAAKAIYNKIHHSFQFKCFLANVRDITSQHDLLYLQQKFVSDILRHAKSQIISSVDAGIPVIKHHLQRRRILVIIDNVDKVEQLNAIVGNCDWFGPGSIIIITTRDDHLLNQRKVNMRYPARLMNKEEALELFSWHTFDNSCPNEEYLELSKKVVSYCGGLPLALEVLGSSLIGRPIIEWESHLEKLKRIPEEEIIEKLKISLDGLDDTQKTIFLDICFFLEMDMEDMINVYVTEILDGCGCSATIGINVLRERCLITVECDHLMMHGLIRKMGKIIISEKSPTEPGRWSRLWDLEAVTNVLTNKYETEAIEGITLDLPGSINASFSTKAFANTKKLRLLQLNNVQLRWLCWHGFPFKSMPKHLLNQPKLVSLDLHCSKLRRGWKNSKELEMLKILDLSRSCKLKKVTRLFKAPKSRRIEFSRLLTLVDFTFCWKLRYLPGEFHKLKSVETLILSESSLREQPEGLGEMVSLRKLDAHRTCITQIPSSKIRLKNLIQRFLPSCNLTDGAIPGDLGSLISLQDLDLRENSCRSLPSLSGLSKLVNLRLNICRNLRAIPDLPINLELLSALGCPALETMSDFSQMSNMRELYLPNSPKVTEVPGLGLDKSLNLTAEFRNNILQGWTSCRTADIYLNGIYDIPEWFEFCDGRNFKGSTLCCIYSGIQEYHPFDIAVVNCTKHTTLRAAEHSWGLPYSLCKDYFWQGQLSNDKLKLSLQGGDEIVILLEGSRVRAMKIGVNLVWDKPLKEIMHHGLMHHYSYTSESEPHTDWLYDESSPGQSCDASDNHPSN
ncbi:TMV resistance protein N-like [Pyrus ussuriensis x Pyrus communis]|uniref:TMV resistance protein N-like n=1 Tax=Pyrus ussuriensis x Pyrus communis TaxID=2448454 RepID=A0A5N5FIN5_9ROSA|nr:TMV resistance protein N-like [Pyrus ussuriensis x Pyrus communis]